MYRPFSGVHGSIVDKGIIYTLCDTMSTVHQSCETIVILMYLIVFAATLFLVAIRLHSGTEQLRLPDLYPSYTTSIRKHFCDVTYGRKTCCSLSLKVSAPISFRWCTITPTKYNVVYFWSPYTFLKTGKYV